MEVVPHFEDHVITNKSKLWRYLDFTKFVDLIINKRLYFRRIDLYEDPYEGYISESYKTDLSSQYSYLKKELKLSEENYDDLLHSHINGLEAIPFYSYASCWNLGDVESAAMWKLYGGSNDCIAICSTVNDLAVTLEEENDEENGNLHLKNIKYTNHLAVPDTKNWLAPMFEKRESFSYENEFRALFVLNDGLKHLSSDNFKALPKKDVLKNLNEDGFYLNIDVIKLVNCIYISPTASKLFHELIESLLVLTGLEGIECIQSDLYKLK